MDHYFALLILLLFVLSVVTNFFLLRTYYLGLKKASLDPLKKILKLRKPAVGGVGIVLVYLVSIIIASIKFELKFFSTTQFVFLNAGAVMAFVWGSVMEIKKYGFYLKIAGQLIVISIFVLGDLQIDIFPNEILNVIVTAVWLVLIMNAFSMINSMNAICSIVSSFTVIFFLLHLAITRNIDSLSMLAFGGLWAALFGFLFFNWFPAQLRLGEGGTLFLGALLSVVAIPVCWNAKLLAVDIKAYPGWLVALLLFLLPLADLLIVATNRLIEKQPLLTNRNDHIANHLHYLGIRKNMVAVTFSFLSMIHFTAALIVAYYIDSWTNIVYAVFVGYALFLTLTLFVIVRTNLQRNKYSY